MAVRPCIRVGFVKEGRPDLSLGFLGVTRVVGAGGGCGWSKVVGGGGGHALGRGCWKLPPPTEHRAIGSPGVRASAPAGRGSGSRRLTFPGGGEDGLWGPGLELTVSPIALSTTHPAPSKTRIWCFQGPCGVKPGYNPGTAARVPQEQDRWAQGWHLVLLWVLELQVHVLTHRSKPRAC